jgi:hypothetical protein
MTEHLPECADKSVMPHNLDCFCDVIRACEERITAAAVQRVEGYLQHDVADGWMPRSKAEGIIAVLKGNQP